MKKISLNQEQVDGLRKNNQKLTRQVRLLSKDNTILKKTLKEKVSMDKEIERGIPFYELLNWYQHDATVSATLTIREVIDLFLKAKR